jgi:glycosyltransferase involved in cell wall biosynthesis
MKRTLSVVISAFNEEKHLTSCLSSVSFADEIIVVDNSSSDSTKRIASSFTKKIFTRENDLMLNKNKNFGFTKANGDYILNLDADEEIPPDLALEIQEILTSPEVADGYWMSRKNIIFGKWIQNGMWWPDKQIRLFRRSKGSFPCIHIHEYISIVGTIESLVHPYIHHNYDSVSQYLTKLERCTTSEAGYLIDTKYQFSWFDAVRFPVSDFVKTYFLEKAYKSGLHGLVLSFLQAFYSFVVFTKVWEHAKFPEKMMTPKAFEKEIRERGKEIRYWLWTVRIENSTFFVNKVFCKVLRKFFS